MMGASGLRRSIERRLDDAALPWSNDIVLRVTAGVVVAAELLALAVGGWSMAAVTAIASVVGAWVAVGRLARASRTAGRPRVAQPARSHRPVPAIRHFVAHRVVRGDCKRATAVAREHQRAGRRGGARCSAGQRHRRVGVLDDRRRRSSDGCRARAVGGARWCRGALARRCRRDAARPQRSATRGPGAVEPGSCFRGRDRRRPVGVRRSSPRRSSRARSTSCCGLPRAWPASSSASCSTAWVRLGCTGWRRSHEVSGVVRHGLVRRVAHGLDRRTPTRDSTWVARAGCPRSAASAPCRATRRASCPCAHASPSPPGGRDLRLEELADVVDLFALAVGSGLNLRLARRRGGEPCATGVGRSADRHRGPYRAGYRCGRRVRPASR